MWTPAYYSDSNLETNPWAEGIVDMRLPDEQLLQTQTGNDETLDQDLEAASLSRHAARLAGANQTGTVPLESIDLDYICLCFQSQKLWRLHQIGISLTDLTCADQKLFRAIQRAVRERKRPFWVERIRSPLLRTICAFRGIGRAG